jgi:hypothetical protein
MKAFGISGGGVWAAAFRMIEDRRKRVGYIGHEHELVELYRLR